MRAEARAGGDEVTEEDVLLEADEFVLGAAEGGLGEDLGGLLEGGAGEERLGLEGGLGDAQQQGSRGGGLGLAGLGGVLRRRPRPWRWLP